MPHWTLPVSIIIILDWRVEMIFPGDLLVTMIMSCAGTSSKRWRRAFSDFCSPEAVSASIFRKRAMRIFPAGF
jgi:hypothetical protein